MQIITLKATPRSGNGKGPARRLRASGRLPAVAYAGGKTVAIAIEREALKSILKSELGRNTVIEMAVEGSESFHVMVKDYSVHPITRQLIHADFMRIDASAPIEVEVPFFTVGKSKGEIEGGTLLAMVRTLRVRCQPADIPTRVEYDVSAMEINDVVRADQLTMPAGVVPLLPPTRKVVFVAPPRVEVEVKPEGEGLVPVEGEEGAVPAEGAPAEGAAEAGEKGERADKGDKRGGDKKGGDKS